MSLKRNSHVGRLRTNNILREIAKRMLSEQGWFTLPDVAAGVDASLLPHVIPEYGRRFIRKLCRMGHLEHEERKYRMTTSGYDYILSLTLWSPKMRKINEYRFRVFLDANENALPQEDKLDL